MNILIIMKIVNVCVNPYVDGWGYQENLLPDYEAKAGHEVVVIAQANHFPKYLSMDEVKEIKRKGKDYHIGDIHVYRTNFYLNTNNISFICTGIYKLLNREQPDVIFHHGVNASSILVCAWYKKHHPSTKLFVDNHADYINESKYKLWNSVILHGFMGSIIRLTDKYIDKYYGVTPGRCTFLREVYCAPQEKIKLLPIGGDTDLIDSIKLSREDLRRKYGIPQDNFVICSGGKMGKYKGTDNLIASYTGLKSKIPNLKLLLFGSYLDEDTEKRSKETEGVFNMGWCDRMKTLELLKLSDTAVWPIHHTTLIEDAVASALPIIVRETSNTSHLVSGNGIFLKHGTVEEISEAVLRIFSENSTYKDKAEECRDKFSYKKIVQTIEEDCK